MERLGEGFILQGSLRSLILVPIESAYATSYIYTSLFTVNGSITVKKWKNTQSISPS